MMGLVVGARCFKTIKNCYRRANNKLGLLLTALEIKSSRRRKRFHHGGVKDTSPPPHKLNNGLWVRAQTCASISIVHEQRRRD